MTEKRIKVDTFYTDDLTVQDIGVSRNNEIIRDKFRQVMRLREDGIRQALIALGWLPPDLVDKTRKGLMKHGWLPPDIVAKNYGKWTSTPPANTPWGSGLYWCKFPDGDMGLYWLDEDEDCGLSPGSEGSKYRKVDHYCITDTEDHPTFSGCRWFGPLWIPEDVEEEFSNSA